MFVKEISKQEGNSCDSDSYNNRDLEKIICRDYTLGHQFCWFTYNKNSKENIPKTLSEINCRFCRAIFKAMSAFMRHRKLNHSDNISECRYYTNFIHEICDI